MMQPRGRAAEGNEVHATWESNPGRMIEIGNENRKALMNRNPHKVELSRTVTCRIAAIL